MQHRKNKTGWDEESPVTRLQGERAVEEICEPGLVIYHHQVVYRGFLGGVNCPFKKMGQNSTSLLFQLEFQSVEYWVRHSSRNALQRKDNPSAPLCCYFHINV